jgi:hypothetical protein
LNPDRAAEGTLGGAGDSSPRPEEAIGCVLRVRRGCAGVVDVELTVPTIVQRPGRSIPSTFLGGRSMHVLLLVLWGGRSRPELAE